MDKSYLSEVIPLIQKMDPLLLQRIRFFFSISPGG